MIRIYGMPTCPDCAFIEKQIEGRAEFEYVNIGAHVHLLKEFLKLRDTEAAFTEARAEGRAGIPCFVLEDGTVTLTPEDAGLRAGRLETAASAETVPGIEADAALPVGIPTEASCDFVRGNC